MDQRRVEFGDWQTPQALADAVLRVVQTSTPRVGSVLEPTCGRGSFLRAAASTFPEAALVGFDISQEHLNVARTALPRSAVLGREDFFGVKWEAVLRGLPEPILILGNPPWVTNSALGALDADNLPRKANFKGDSGFDAMTGKSNFDISEWMLLRLLEGVQGLTFTLAMLCKASVARRVMERVATQRWRVAGAVHGIDAREHFGAAVDAVLLTVRGEGSTSGAGDRDVRWPVYGSLDASRPSRHMGVLGGRTYSDVDAYLSTRSLEGESELEWRSGIKHDCSRVMELAISHPGLVNGAGEPVELEPEYVFPLLKGSDLANGRMVPRRSVIVTQRRLGADTSEIKRRAPLTWAYLTRHRDELDARKSSIYRNQPRFAIFGVGDYAFAPFKVAICGLYKRFAFVLVEPIGGRPVMLDDTCYFLPCESRERADELVRALRGDRARAFFEARVFWDTKRPISKALLRSISLEQLVPTTKGHIRARARPVQQELDV